MSAPIATSAKVICTPPLQTLVKAIQLLPDGTEQLTARYNRGHAHQLLESWAATIADYTAFIEQVPIFARAYMDRGVCHHLLGDNHAAIADFDRAIPLLPDGLDKALTYCNRGMVYDAMNDYQAAPPRSIGP